MGAKIKCICPICNSEFEKIKHENKIYCSLECRVKYNRSLRALRFCATCGKEVPFNSKHSARNKNYYCNTECFRLRKIPYLKNVTRRTGYWQKLIEESICECGEKRNYLLQIHHIDGNHKNNDDSNIEIVCGNCHLKRHLKIGVSGKLVWSPKALTDRNLLKEL